MKIILQPEARTISNYQIVRNQQELIELINKPKKFILSLSELVKSLVSNQSGDRSCDSKLS